MIREKRLIIVFLAMIFGLLAIGIIAAYIIQPDTVHADSRVNCHNASPVIIFCSDLGVTVYSTNGDKLLFVSSDVIDEVGTPDEHTLVISEGNITFYVLSTGEYQINVETDTELYVAIWTGCHIGSADLAAYSLATGELLSDDEGCEVKVVEPVVCEGECLCGPPPEQMDSDDAWLWASCMCPDGGGDIDYGCSCPLGYCGEFRF